VGSEQTTRYNAKGKSENPNCTSPIYEEKVAFIENKYKVPDRK
jgi:hypothetical protein